MEHFKEGTLSSSYKYQLDFPRNKNVADFLLKKAEEHCQNGLGAAKWITNTETDEFTTFSQVDPLSRNVGSGLFKLGLRHGDIVMYNATNPSRLHVFFLGVWRANGILRSIYPQENQDAVAEKIIECRARFFLCDTFTLENVRGAVSKVQWPVEIIVFGDAQNYCKSADELLQDDGESCPESGGPGPGQGPEESEETDAAIVLQTSGTTGASKGVVHTHAGVLKSILTYEHCFYFHDPNHPFLAMGTQTHFSGFIFSFVTLVAGRDTLTMRNTTSENILQAVHTYKPSLVYGFPSAILCLANPEASKNLDLSSVKIFMTGGLVIPPSYIATMESIPGVSASARVMTGYGMTECGAFVSSKNCSLPTLGHLQDNYIFKDVPSFSPGKLVPGTSLQVRDLATNECLGPNQRGELYVWSPITCAGYYNKPEETKLAFPDGWVKTGDVGYFDENGFVFVVDRSKDTFKYYNDHISPSEVEDVIVRHDAVENVCVVGIVDPEGGDHIPRAFVTLKNPEASADEIRKFANDILPPYKQLRGGLIILPELPIGKTGKVSRDILKKVQISLPRTNDGNLNGEEAI